MPILTGRPSLCPICGTEFGGRTKRKQQLDHIRTVHPEFWHWRDRYNKIGYLLVASFVVFLAVGATVQTGGGINTVPAWYLPVFIGLVVAMFAMALYWRWGVRGFKRE